MNPFDTKHECRVCREHKGFFDMVLVRGQAQSCCKECKNERSRRWQKANLGTREYPLRRPHPWGGLAKRINRKEKAN